MRQVQFASVFTALLMACLPQASAQNPPRGAPPSTQARPYKPVAIALPKPMADASFDALRKQIGEAAARKDRAALARLVVAQGFFWQRENGNSADKRKSGIDNLANALGLNNKEGAGWDMLAGYAEDPSASVSAEHKGAVCALGDPAFDRKAFDELIKATQTDAMDWGYTVSDGIEVHASTQADSPVIDKLGLGFVRISPANKPGSAAYMRIVTPAGATGYVSVDSIAPIGNDQICYVKDGSGWKIGGYIGGGDPQ